MNKLCPCSVIIALLATASCADDLLDTVLFQSPSLQSKQEAVTAASSQPDMTTGNEAQELSAYSYLRDSARNDTISTWTGGSLARFISWQKYQENGGGSRPYSAFSQLSGGVGDASSYFGNIDFSFPVAPVFDISCHFFTVHAVEESTGSGQRLLFAGDRWTGHYYYAPYSTKDTCTSDVKGGDVALLWMPFRGGSIEPFLGLGLRYVSSQNKDVCVSDYYAANHDTDENSNSASFNVRCGLKIHFGRITLKGDFIYGEGLSELIGDVGLRVLGKIYLHGIAESAKIKYDHEDVSTSETYVMYGGGVSVAF